MCARDKECLGTHQCARVVVASPNQVKRSELQNLPSGGSSMALPGVTAVTG